MTTDEDEVVEIVRFSGDVSLTYVGLDLAQVRARSAYLQGRISVEEFEDEIDRILRKRAALHPHA